MAIADFQLWIPWILGLVLIGGSIALAAFSNLLKDSSAAAKAPFSFARVQFLWWVLILTYCALHYYARMRSLPTLNETCLVLLGIGAGTFGIAKVLDQRQRASSNAVGAQVSQDAESKGFITDILSDNAGLSVHRLQALIFNVIYGVAFVSHFVEKETFAVYDNVQFAVLGLSSAGYLGLKAFENNPNAAPTTVSGPGGDELPDADAAAAPAPLASG